MTETLNTQVEMDDAAGWYAAATGGTFDRPASADDEGKGGPHTTSHPLATLAAIVHTATRSNVPADVLAGHFLADHGDDVGDMHYASQVFVDRAYNDYGRALREAHTLFHAHDTHGDTDKSLRNVPDGYTRVQSSSVQRRSNTGVTYKEVKRHGRSYVGGSHVGTPNRGASMSVAHLAHAIETAPRTSLGHVDGIALNRIVDAAYGLTHVHPAGRTCAACRAGLTSLPRLSGADTVAWADFAAWDEIRAAAPRKGLKPRLTLPRVPAGAYDAAPHELISFRTESYTTTDNEGRETFHPATVFVGHRVAERIATVRAQRAARGKRVDEAFTVSDVSDVVTLLAVVGNDEPGRYTWSAGERRGTITVTRTGRVGVTGLGADIRGARTIAAAQRAAAKALAGEPDATDLALFAEARRRYEATKR
jgi:hypothetical protein